MNSSRTGTSTLKNISNNKIGNNNRPISSQ